MLFINLLKITTDGRMPTLRLPNLLLNKIRTFRISSINCGLRSKRDSRERQRKEPDKDSSI